MDLPEQWQQALSSPATILILAAPAVVLFIALLFPVIFKQPPSKSFKTAVEAVKNIWLQALIFLAVVAMLGLGLCWILRSSPPATPPLQPVAEKKPDLQSFADVTGGPVTKIDKESRTVTITDFRTDAPRAVKIYASTEIFKGEQKIHFEEIKIGDFIGLYSMDDLERDDAFIPVVTVTDLRPPPSRVDKL